MVARRAAIELRGLEPTAWPAAARVLAGDLAARAGLGGVAAQPVDGRRALDEVVAWLARAQDATPDGGISAWWSLVSGWARSYPETTGYAIPTLLRYAEVRGAPDFRERALRAAGWLLGLQLEGGAFPGGFERGGQASVFNTGQILHGLVAAWRETGDEQLLAAAVRAAEWLDRVQGPDGAWSRFVYSAPNPYYVMVSRGLLDLWRAAGVESARATAERNLAWTQARFDPRACLHPCDLPTRAHLHFVAYTLQGLVACGLALERHDLIAQARRTCDRLLDELAARGRLPGAIEAGWRPAWGYVCPTGEAQVAWTLLRLAGAGEGERYRAAAARLRERVCRHVRLAGPPGVRGGVPGSSPIWGPYCSLRYPNWAAKFLADALLEEDHPA